MSRPAPPAPGAGGLSRPWLAVATRIRSSGLPASIVRLAFGSAFLAFAGSFIWPLNTIYVHDVLGRSLTAAGFALVVQAGASVVASVAGGRLYDLWGGRRTIVLGASVEAGGAALVGIAPGFAPYVGALAVLGFGAGLVMPAMNALAGEVWAEGGRAAFNAVYVSRNAGVALGAAVGGLVATFDFRAVFFTNAALVALFALYMLRFPDPGRGPARRIRSGTPAGPDPEPRPGAGGATSALLADGRLVRLALGFFLAQTAYTQWTTTVATHMQALGFGVARYSALWTLNGALILAGQPAVSRVARLIPDLRAQLLLGTAAYVAVFVALVWVEGYASFVGLMALLTFGEMLVWPGVPAAADRLAPQGRRGAYQGVVSGAGSLGRMLGPLAGGFAYDVASPQAAFAAMAGVLVLSGFAFAGSARAPRAVEEGGGRG
ncbi:MAG: MFS transporter [Clostridia bacterium]|nr:MFS transporter [Clostridia bacterium]